MSTRTRLILVLALLVISLTTIFQAFVSNGESQVAYVVATSISHIALLITGFWYNQGRQEKHNKWREQLREDVLGK